MARIILASGSPRRQELLQRIGLREFEISVPDVEEWYPPELVPEDIVAYISREKSQAVQAPADAIVITADTMVFLDDQRLGKPHDEAEALMAVRRPKVRSSAWQKFSFIGCLRILLLFLFSKDYIGENAQNQRTGNGCKRYFPKSYR